MRIENEMKQNGASEKKAQEHFALFDGYYSKRDVILFT